MHDGHTTDPVDHAFTSGQAHAPSRRDFLKTALALGLAAHGLPARAASGGRVLFGFTLTQSLEAMLGTLFQQLQARYRPDLGARPVFLPGNSGVVAMDAVINAPADGATAFLSSSASMTLLPLVRKEVIDPVRLLQPVTGIGVFCYAFVVGPAVPSDVKTMASYLMWANANPVLATYGVTGRGTASHFIGTEVARMSEVPLKSVAYRGLPPMIDDVAKGNLPAAVTVRLNGSDLADHPSVRVLAVSSGARWPTQDDIPSLLEVGLADSPTIGSFGIFVSSRTPATKMAELDEALRLALHDPSVRSAMERAEVPQLPATEDYAALIARERAEWQSRIARHAFSADA